MTQVRGRVWRDGRVIATDFPLDDLDTHLADDTALTWLDLHDPAEEVLAQLAAELRFDRHAVEDAVAPRERPKATRHAGHTFLTCYAASLVEGAQELPALAIGRISAFVLPRGLITIRVARGAEVDMDEVVERWEGSGLLRHGVGALVGDEGQGRGVVGLRETGQRRQGAQRESGDTTIHAERPRARRRLLLGQFLDVRQPTLIGAGYGLGGGLVILIGGRFIVGVAAIKAGAPADRRNRPQGAVSCHFPQESQ